MTIQQMLFSGNNILELIESVQQVDVIMPNGLPTIATAAISAVNPANTVLFWNGLTFTDNTTLNQPRAIQCMAELTSATQVTITRAVALNTSTYPRVTVTVVEFKAKAVKSVQRGFVDVNGVTSAAQSISAVNLNNAFVLFNGLQTSLSGAPSDAAFWAAGIALTGNTTITATKGAGSGNCRVAYSVIEFVPGVIKSNYKVEAVIPASQTTGTVSLPAAVDTSKVLLAYGGFSLTGTGSNPILAPRCYLSNSTTVGAACHSSAVSPNVQTSYVTVIEFNPNLVDSGTAPSGHNASISSGSTQADVTIPARDLSKTFVYQLGYYGTATPSVGNTYNAVIGSVKLTSSTNVRGEKAISGSSTGLVVGYGIITLI